MTTLNIDPLSQINLHLPQYVFKSLLAAFDHAEMATLISVILPISLLGVIASLQNIESAAAAGDDFPERPCLVKLALWVRLFLDHLFRHPYT